MADRLATGTLAQILSQKRSEGKSFDAISRDLFATYGIEATAQTVTNWCDMLEIPRSGDRAAS